MDNPITSFFIVIPLIVGVIVVVRVIAGSMDRQRIAEYVETRGGKVIEVNWAPFGPGWLSGNKERIYEIRYCDDEGNIHLAFARTNMWSGVYFTEDRIIRRARPTVDLEHVESLEEENARLRAELERLKRNQGDDHSEAIKE